MLAKPQDFLEHNKNYDQILFRAPLHDLYSRYKVLATSVNRLFQIYAKGCMIQKERTIKMSRCVNKHPKVCLVDCCGDITDIPRIA